MIIIITIAFAKSREQPATAIMFAVFGLVVTVILGFLNLGWVSLILVIIAGVYFAIKSNT